MKKFFMRIAVTILKLFLNIVYFFMKKTELKTKVVFISRQSNYPSLDFRLIEDEIIKQNKNIEIKTFCKKIDKGILNKIKYSFYMLNVMKNLADSKVCIIDGYEITVSMLKQREELVVIQIWHALGAIKKFGYQSLGKSEGRDKKIAEIMNMHKNYTYVIASSKATKELYRQAFNVEKDQILIMGMPRIDYILKNDKNISTSISKDYPEVKHKENILYVPTFRKGKKIEAQDLIKNVDTKKYNLIIKKHPLEEIEDGEGYIVDRRYKAVEWLNVADFVITDYSAIAFESIIKNIPTYFYVYDIEEYEKNRGLNIDLFREMPNSTDKDIKNLIKKIEENKYNYDELQKFKMKYIETTNSNNTKKITELIIKNM